MDITAYDVLEISESASLDEVKRAYLKLAKKYHPDVCNDVSALDRMKNINLAYEAVKNGLGRWWSPPFSHAQTLPDEPDEPEMTLAEKIFARHMVSAEGKVGVPAVKPGDTGFTRVDLRFSHEYVTPMAESLFKQALGKEARVTEPESVYAFRDHLTFLGRVMSEDKRKMGLLERADGLARCDAGDRVRHVHADTLLAHHDRADVGVGGMLDQMVDRIAAEDLDPLALHDFRDCRAELHGVSPQDGRLPAFCSATWNRNRAGGKAGFAVRSGTPDMHRPRLRTPHFARPD